MAKPDCEAHLLALLLQICRLYAIRLTDFTSAIQMFWVQLMWICINEKRQKILEQIEVNGSQMSHGMDLRLHN